jgi:hypothetical protein
MESHSGRHLQIARRARPARARTPGRRERRARVGALAARARGARPLGGVDERVADQRRCRLGAFSVRAGTQRWLAGVAGRTTGGTRPGPLQLALSGADADHVRQLCAGAGRRAEPARKGAGVRDRGGQRDPAARAAVDLPGRLRVHLLRPPGGAPRSGPVYACGRRSADRPGVRLHRLALPGLAVWTAVHGGQLRAGSARGRRGVLGVQGDRGAQLPRCGGARRQGGRAPRALSPVGRGVRGAEPGDARAVRRWRTQRHAADARVGGRAGAHRPCREQGLLAALRRGRAGGGRGRQADRGSGAAVSRAGGRERAGAHAGGGAGGPGAAGGRACRRARVRRACARIPQHARRGAAAGGHPQHPGGDGAAGGAERDPGMVAPSVHRRVRGGAGVCAVAHRARCGLACGGRLEHDRAAVLDRMAVAVVCGVGAAASGRQRRAAPARRRARAVRLRGPHPPAACQPAAQPGSPPRRHAHPRPGPAAATPPRTHRSPGA